MRDGNGKDMLHVDQPGEALKRYEAKKKREAKRRG